MCRCSVTSLGVDRQLLNITLEEFPAVPYENNIFSHNGNPPLSHFSCDVSNAYTSTGSGFVNCTIEDTATDNIKGENM